MSQFPLAARLFVWIVIVTGFSLLVWLNQPPQLPSDWAPAVVIVVLFFASALSDFFRISLGYKIEVTLATASNFAALLIFGLPIGVAVGTSSSLTCDVLWRKPWYKVLFNAANTSISIACAGALFALLGDGSPPLGSIRGVLATGAAGSSYLIVNCALVCLAIGFTTGANPFNVAKSNLKGVGLQVATLIPVGTLIVVVYGASPWALLLVFFPILLVHYSFENYQKLRRESMRTIEMLASTIDKRDAYTFRHSQRVAEFAEKIARRLGLGPQETESVVFASRVHDLGKVGLDTNILLKSTKLTPEEWSKVEEHPAIGAAIISQLSVYREVKDMVSSHQERYDGKGYPAGLKGAEIPLGARIIAVADAFEAMTSDRPYRRALSVEQAVAELERCRGSQFDPIVVDAFLAVLGAAPVGKGEQMELAPDPGVG